ncbi:MAG: NAD(P)H-hydrate dehydratase [Bacteroidales bacterium]|nr:NAD(P)H-hydrate dehydratase [Bacteroidales bacterium]
MQKIFVQKDIRLIDQMTISRQGISSLDLMERAAITVSEWLMRNVCTSVGNKVSVLAGPGNNGGDGMVVARHLAMIGCSVRVFSFTGREGRRSDDCESNVKRLPASVELIVDAEDIDLSDCDLVVDALLGTGLTRPVEDGRVADAIRCINSSESTVVSIDMPSGMGDEEMMKCMMSGEVVKADYTVTFQMPKISFLMPESEPYVGKLIVTDIGLDESAMSDIESRYYMTDAESVASLVKPRSRYAHKGSAGRAMIVAGSKGMMGAAQLAANGCMRSGVGLLTMAIPEVGCQIIQTGVPEAMAMVCGVDEVEWNDELMRGRYNAVGIGPGLGRGHNQKDFVMKFIESFKDTPMVIDADALFLLGKIDDIYDFPTHAVITPHEAEFDRLTEPHDTRMSRIDRASGVAVAKQCVVVLKGAYTTICMPDGRVIFNPTGNAGMATGGSGDVLTGVLTALLAQGYSVAEAALLGVYKHGEAGDVACRNSSEMGMTSGDIAKEIAKLWK